VEGVSLMATGAKGMMPRPAYPLQKGVVALAKQAIVRQTYTGAHAIE